MNATSSASARHCSRLRCVALMSRAGSSGISYACATPCARMKNRSGTRCSRLERAQLHGLVAAVALGGKAILEALMPRSGWPSNALAKLQTTQMGVPAQPAQFNSDALSASAFVRRQVEIITIYLPRSWRCERRFWNASNLSRYVNTYSMRACPNSMRSLASCAGTVTLTSCAASLP
jgi:hypothetical protein